MGTTPAQPDVTVWTGPTSSGLVFRNGTPFAAKFGEAWRAQAAAENAARMDRKARRAALGSLEEQAAALALDLADAAERAQVGRAA